MRCFNQGNFSVTNQPSRWPAACLIKVLTLKLDKSNQSQAYAIKSGAVLPLL